MRESDLYVPIRDWLNSHGHAVHAEVFGCDVVAIRGNEITAVELKVALPAALLVQLNQRAMWADWIYGAMPHRPKNTAIFKSYGFGLLVVKGGKVTTVVRPRRQPHYWHKRHAYRIKKLSGRAPAQPHELAGLPSCADLREQRRLRDQITGG